MKFASSHRTEPIALSNGLGVAEEVHTALFCGWDDVAHGLRMAEDLFVSYAAKMRFLEAVAEAKADAEARGVLFVASPQTINAMSAEAEWAGKAARARFRAVVSSTRMGDRIIERGAANE